jgi:hypothetical protein
VRDHPGPEGGVVLERGVEDPGSAEKQIGLPFDGGQGVQQRDDFGVLRYAEAEPLVSRRDAAQLRLGHLAVPGGGIESGHSRPVRQRAHFPVDEDGAPSLLSRMVRTVPASACP